MTGRRVILLEFNELTPSLLDRFFAEGWLQNFKRFYDDSVVYVTDAEEEGDLLNPWVQWVTVHTGLSAAEHGLTSLNQGHLLDKPRVWDIASRAGMSAFVCGSMNVDYDDDFNGFVLPDPWTTTVEPYPESASLVDFYRFVQMQVQEYTNESVPLSKGDYAWFLKFMVSHGMSMHTTTSIVKQLASEKVAGGGRWKRAFLLDKLQWDVFRSIFNKHHPNFSTFFLNSTAHLQHAYWRHMDPEPFKMRPDQEEREEYGRAVLSGYEEMDKLLGQILDLAGTDTTVVFSTALGQQPYLLKEDQGGKRFYRPKNFDGLTAFAGIEAPHTCSPVMSEQFRIYFENASDADAAIRLLEELNLAGRQILSVRRENDESIFTGCMIFEEIPKNAVMTSSEGAETPFYNVFYSPDTTKSGAHHPHGALWIRTPARHHRVQEERVSLRAVAPTLIRLLGLELPEFMSERALGFEPWRQCGRSGRLRDHQPHPKAPESLRNDLSLRWNGNDQGHSGRGSPDRRGEPQGKGHLVVSTGTGCGFT